jgi:hypothetical protein
MVLGGILLLGGVLITFASLKAGWVDQSVVVGYREVRGPFAAGWGTLFAVAGVIASLLGLWAMVSSLKPRRPLPHGRWRRRRSDASIGKRDCRGDAFT